LLSDAIYKRDMLSCRVCPSVCLLVCLSGVWHIHVLCLKLFQLRVATSF